MLAYPTVNYFWHITQTILGDSGQYIWGRWDPSKQGWYRPLGSKVKELYNSWNGHAVSYMKGTESNPSPWCQWLTFTLIWFIYYFTWQNILNRGHFKVEGPVVKWPLNKIFFQGNSMAVSVYHVPNLIGSTIAIFFHVVLVKRSICGTSI